MVNDLIPIPDSGGMIEGGKKKKAGNKKGVHYVIEKIDGMPNHDLVIQYKNGKKVGQKVIALDNLKAASANSLAKNNQAKGKKTKVVYVQGAPQQPVVVQKQAGFGDYLVAGFGFGLGAEAADALFDGIDDAYDY